MPESDKNGFPSAATAELVAETAQPAAIRAPEAEQSVETFPHGDQSTSTAVNALIFATPTHLSLAVASRAELADIDASKEFMALVEDMPESPTGLGVRTPCGMVQITHIGSDVRCEGTLPVNGPSLSKPLELVISLDYDVNDKDIDFDYAPRNTPHAELLCYRALANNPHLAGRIIQTEDGYSLYYKWRDKTIPMMSSRTRQLFFEQDPAKCCSPKTRLFNPATVTPAELDFALAELFKVPLLPEETPPPDVIPADELKEYEVTSEPVDEIAENSLNEPKFVQGKHGPIAYGTDKGVGYNPWNEDAVVVNSEKGFAVIDGLGGHEGGQESAGLLAIEFKHGFRKDLPFEHIHNEAHYSMNRSGGACYIGARIQNERLYVGQAGDVKLMVIGADGTIKFITKDERSNRYINGKFREVVDNTVSGFSSGRAKLSDTPLAVGDRIVVASDGLFDNVEPDEVAVLIQGKTIQEAIQILNIVAKKKMKHCSECKAQGLSKPSGAKTDNISILIYDIERL